MIPAMDSTDAHARLAEAERLSATSRAASGWYGRYLVVFGVASFFLAASFAVVHPFVIAAVITPVWLALVLGLTVTVVLRRRVAVRGYAGIHCSVMAAWTGAWMLTLNLTLLQGRWPWPVLGGCAMAGAAFAGAFVAHRRSRA